MAYPGSAYESGMPSMPSGRYEIAVQVNRLNSGVQALELKTRVTGCRRASQPYYATERIELYSPDGKLIHSLEKLPKALGWRSYAGGFVIEFPPSVPDGTYGFVAMLEFNGQNCARYDRGFMLRQ